MRVAGGQAGRRTNTRMLTSKTLTSKSPSKRTCCLMSRMALWNSARSPTTASVSKVSIRVRAKLDVSIQQHAGSRIAKAHTHLPRASSTSPREGVRPRMRGPHVTGMSSSARYACFFVGSQSSVEYGEPRAAPPQHILPSAERSVPCIRDRHGRTSPWSCSCPHVVSQA